MLSLEIRSIGQFAPGNAAGAGPTWRDEHGKVFATGELTDGLARIRVDGLATFSIPLEGVSVVQAHALPESDLERVREFFYRTVLPVAAHLRGMEALHASAVRVDGHIIPFAGPSGTGKSTTAYAVARACGSIEHWADDSVIFEIDRRGALAHRLPFEMSLDRDTALHFDLDRKRQWIREPVDGEQGKKEPVGEIVLLDRTGDPSRGELVIEEVSPAEAFRALAQQAFYFDVAAIERTRAMVRTYMRLTDRVPVSRARFAPGRGSLERVADRLADYLLRRRLTD